MQLSIEYCQEFIDALSCPNTIYLRATNCLSNSDSDSKYNQYISLNDDWSELIVAANDLISTINGTSNSTGNTDSSAYVLYSIGSTTDWKVAIEFCSNSGSNTSDNFITFPSSYNGYVHIDLSTFPIAANLMPISNNWTTCSGDSSNDNRIGNITGNYGATSQGHYHNNTNINQSDYYTSFNEAYTDYLGVISKYGNIHTVQNITNQIPIGSDSTVVSANPYSLGMDYYSTDIKCISISDTGTYSTYTTLLIIDNCRINCGTDNNGNAYITPSGRYVTGINYQNIMPIFTSVSGCTNGTDVTDILSNKYPKIFDGNLPLIDVVLLCAKGMNDNKNTDHIDNRLFWKATEYNDMCSKDPEEYATGYHIVGKDENDNDIYEVNDGMKMATAKMAYELLKLIVVPETDGESDR